MNRRGFLQGILSAGVAPYVCTAAGVLMPVKRVITPKITFHRVPIEWDLPPHPDFVLVPAWVEQEIRLVTRGLQ